MLNLISSLAIAVGLISTPTWAEPCVKVRNGRDGYDCMKFSTEARKEAMRYGLQLGAPYGTVKERLTKNGWALDENWLKEEDPFYSRRGDLVCGHGWDAICWTVYRKEKETVSMVFSGTNDGTPLIGVDTEPSDK